MAKRTIVDNMTDVSQCVTFECMFISRLRMETVMPVCAVIRNDITYHWNVVITCGYTLEAIRKQSSKINHESCKVL